MVQYRTKEDDMLDEICVAYYGKSQSFVEAVLEANPGLSEVGALYPAGLIVELPEFPTIEVQGGQVRLWD